MEKDEPSDGLLRKLGRLAPLNAELREAVRRWPTVARRFDRGRAITREHGETQSCLLLVSGLVARHKMTVDGKQQILSLLVPGDMMDLHRYFGRRDDAEMVAVSPVQVAAIRTSVIRQTADEHPLLAQALVADTLLEAAIGREWLLNVGQRDATRRVAHLLCEAAIRLSATGFGEPTSFHFPLTQAHIANAVGLTSVHVNRTLRGLQDQELITYGAQHVVIRDLPRLRTVGDFNPAYLQELAPAA